MIMAFVIMGEPVAQGRPRFAHVNGHAIAYDPPKSKDTQNGSGYRAVSSFILAAKKPRYTSKRQQAKILSN